MKKDNLVFAPIFLVSLLVLLTNDFYLKQTYSNQLTGKLSDFAGLIVFPVFVAYIIPSSKKWISVITAGLFIIWKMPITTPLIDTINLILPFKVQRVIDYSDFWALWVLLISHKIIQRTDTKQKIGSTFILKLSKGSIVFVAFFAICATSRIPRAEIPKGTIHLGESYRVKKSKEETIQMIKSLGYNVDYYNNPDDDSTTYIFRRPYYQTDNIIIYDDNKTPVDTILNVRYNLYEIKKEEENKDKNEKETSIYVFNITLKNPESLLKLKKIKHLRKQYKEILEKNMIEKMR